MKQLMPELRLVQISRVTSIGQLLGWRAVGHHRQQRGGPDGQQGLHGGGLDQGVVTS